VNKLAEFCRVRVRQQNNPGHGIVQIAEPIADGWSYAGGYLIPWLVCK